MKRLFFAVVFVIFSIVFFTECHHDKDSHPADNPKDTCDVRVVLSPLPDTVFPSVEGLEYSITVFDTLTDGRLAWLEDPYEEAPGIFSFRGGHRRDADFHGNVQGSPDTVVIDWVFKTGYDGRSTSLGTWGGGTGWTGQPLYVVWPDSCMERFRRESPALTRHFDKEEIIVGSLDAHVYFINFQTGDSSRRSFYTGNTIKGTASLDPSLNGNLYVGQGVPCTSPFGALTFNLFRHQRTQMFGRDSKAWRNWQAYDSSPIRVGQFLFRLGENGTVYKYLCAGDTLKLHSTLRYRAKGSWAAGMESSMAVYRNYGYFSDNRGNVICVNLNNLQPVWHYFNHDDCDGTPVVEVEEGVPYLYTGCEIDKRKSGLGYLAKLNALTGELVWSVGEEGRQVMLSNHGFDGGFYCTPLLGHGNCEHLVFANFVRNNPSLSGDFMAFNKQTGEVVYRVPLKQYAWSSPVALYNESGELFIFTGDTSGYVYLIDGASGKVLYRRLIGNNFESSPIVVDNHVVVGSRGQEIYKFTVTTASSVRR